MVRAGSNFSADENIIFALSNNPMVSRIACEAILDFTKPNEVQFVEVEFAPECSISRDFFFVRALKILPCTDLEKSEIEWLFGKGSEYMNFDHLVFGLNCLRGHHIAKDKFGGHMVVSDALKEALTDVIATEGIFVRPNDMVSLRNRQMASNRRH